MSVDSKRRVSLVAAAVLAMTFLLGATTGVGIATWTRDSFPHGPPPGPLPLDELDLTHAQRVTIDKILERYHPEFDAVFRSTFPRVQALSESLEAEVREVLDDGQRARWDAFKARRPAFPPPGGPWESPSPGRGPGSPEHMRLPP